MAELKSPRGRFYFYLDPYEFANSEDERKALETKIQWLNRDSSFVVRCAELAVDGIWPQIVAYSEPGNIHLSVFVEYNNRGQAVLRGEGAGWSTLIQSTRYYFRRAYWILAIILVTFILAGRFYKNGWMATAIGLGLLFAVSALSIWIIRKRA